VLRESRGTSAYYRIADAGIYELCDLVCGSIARQLEKLSRRVSCVHLSFHGRLLLQWLHHSAP